MSNVRLKTLSSFKVEIEPKATNPYIKFMKNIPSMFSLNFRENTNPEAQRLAPKGPHH